MSDHPPANPDDAFSLSAPSATISVILISATFFVFGAILAYLTKCFGFCATTQRSAETMLLPPTATSINFGTLRRQNSDSDEEMKTQPYDSPRLPV